MKHLFADLFIAKHYSNISIGKEISDYENGRMDIIISYLENNILKEIVIENKIYHHDGKEQLTRYYNYLIQTRNLKVGQFHLIYLTPHRSKPEAQSISVELYNSLTKIKAMTNWGYYNDIAIVLENLLPFVKAPVVKETVYQYIEAIQSL